MENIFVISKDLYAYPYIFVKKKLIPFLFQSKNIELSKLVTGNNELNKKYHQNVKFLNKLKNRVEKTFQNNNAKNYQVEGKNLNKIYCEDRTQNSLCRECFDI